jgi:hypothetical protein
MRFESLRQYHDFWAKIILLAPDNFTTPVGDLASDQKAALDDSFDVILAGFVFVEKKIKDLPLLAILRELIAMSYEAYKDGDTKRGAHVLQECEGLIWPSRHVRLKYVVEAEQRAFGTVHLFKDVKVSLFPYEGTTADLGPRQRALLDYARAQSQRFLDAREPFKAITWAMLKDDSIDQIRAPSQKKTLARLHAGAASGDIVASVSAHFPFGGYKGLLSFNLEEVGRPRVDAISLVENWVVAPPRYHLYEPEIFSSVDSKV